MDVYRQRSIVFCCIAIIALAVALAACTRRPKQDSAADPPSPTAALTDAERARLAAAEELRQLQLRHYPWLPLEADHLHDPENTALPLLQQPSEALSTLPTAVEGNHVDWVAALRDGHIEPRTNIQPGTKINVIDLDVLMVNTAGMPAVLFPHRAHTEWLDCSNCHDRIFKKGRGTNPMTMLKILQGFYCGQCHGAVAFPLTQCQRCHSIPKDRIPRGKAPS